MKKLNLFALCTLMLPLHWASANSNASSQGKLMFTCTSQGQFNIDASDLDRDDMSLGGLVRRNDGYVFKIYHKPLSGIGAAIGRVVGGIITFGQEGSTCDASADIYELKNGREKQVANNVTYGRSCNPTSNHLQTYVYPSALKGTSSVLTILDKNLASGINGYIMPINSNLTSGIAIHCVR